MTGEQSAPRPHPAPAPTTASAMLIDEFLPHYDYSIAHADIVRAHPRSCYRAARQLDLFQAPLIRTLIGLRALPQRLIAHRTGPGVAAAAAPTFRLTDMTDHGWVLLAEAPNLEMVLGQIGRPWAAADASSGPNVSPDGFATFEEPGFAKIVLNLRVAPYGAESSILTVETRVAVTDAESRRRFGRYWTVVGPFSGLIRRSALRLLATELRNSDSNDHTNSAARRVERLETRIEHVVDTRSVGIGAWLIRRTRGRIVRPWHRRALILTTRGRRSGLPRTVLLQYFPDGPDLIVVAANSGLPTHPGWYFNLKADPQAQVEVDGETKQVRAEELTPQQAAAFWPRILQTAPDYARYLRRTDRVLPLLRLIQTV